MEHETLIKLLLHPIPVCFTIAHCTGTNTMPRTMIYEARKMHKATIARTSTMYCAHFNLHVWEVGKFSGVEMKSWKMDEGGKSRKRLGGGVSESNLSNLSFGNWFLLRRHLIERVKLAKVEGGENGSKGINSPG